MLVDALIRTAHVITGTLVKPTTAFISIRKAAAACAPGTAFNADDLTDGLLKPLSRYSTVQV
jgi:hypothetical protein